MCAVVWTQVGALRRCWAAAELWPSWEADVGEEPYYYQNTESSYMNTVAQLDMPAQMVTVG